MYTIYTYCPRSSSKSTRGENESYDLETSAIHDFHVILHLNGKHFGNQGGGGFVSVFSTSVLVMREEEKKKKEKKRKEKKTFSHFRKLFFFFF